MALQHIFELMERIDHKYRRHSAHNIKRGWHRIQQDGQIQQVQEEINRYHSTATELLEMIVAEITNTHLGTRTVHIDTKERKEVTFKCEGQDHDPTVSRIIARGLFPEKIPLGQLQIGPRDMFYLHNQGATRIFNGKKGDYTVICPDCGDTAKLVETSRLVIGHRNKPIEITTDKKKRKKRLQEIAEAHKYQAYIARMMGINPAIFIHNNAEARTTKDAPFLDSIPSPELVVQSRVKYLSQIQKYFIVKYLEEKRRLEDTLGVKVLVPTLGECYRLIHGTLRQTRCLDCDFERDFEDFIVKPKASGYRSLQIVGCPDLDERVDEDTRNRFKAFTNTPCVEVQTRTYEMELAAMQDSYHDEKTITTRRKIARDPNLDRKYTLFTLIFDPKIVAPHRIH